VPVADLAYRDEARGWVVERTTYEAIVARHAHESTGLTAGFSVH